MLDVLLPAPTAAYLILMIKANYTCLEGDTFSSLASWHEESEVPRMQL